MQYIRFFINNKRLISFGFLLTFFSSFGQTFLLSLYVPKIITEFQLSNSSFGGMYAAATVASSLILVYVGKLIDTVDLRKFTLYTALTLMSACLMLTFSMNIVMIMFALLGLRLAGQGLLSHISNTSIAKHFDDSRGKALSITALGYSAGEGLFPATVSLIIALIGWRYSMAVNSALIGLILIPFVWKALSNYTSPVDIENDNPNNQKFSRLTLFKDQNFYVIAANSVLLPFLATGLFFYQSVIASEKGWTLEWLSFCFIWFAVGRTIFSLLSGKLIDKYSAIKLFPFHLVPLIIGLIILLLFNHQYAAAFYLFLTGISVGLSVTVKSAAIAEIYDRRFLGSVKSLFTTLTVLGTALSPLLFGLILDNGYSFSSIIFVSIIAVSIVVAVSVQILLQPKFAFSMW